MARRGDLPAILANVNGEGSPVPAIIVAGAAIAALVLIGEVEITWSFSAFTVLIYYAITNLAALRLPKAKRLYSPVIAWAGLAACLSLAFFVKREIWMVGVGIILAGLLWYSLARYFVERR
jgi:APA family basic amino acid/polyamine antiporter